MNSSSSTSFRFALTVTFAVLSVAIPLHASAADRCDHPDRLEETEIRTSKFDVSHVYAPDLYSLSYANGWVQARDRLFQLDALRHIGHGNSASLVGPEGFKRDFEVARRLYTEEEMHKQFQEAPNKIKTMLKGFTDGINTKMCRMFESGNVPAEFYVLAHNPDYWETIDSIAIADFLIGIFGTSGGGQLKAARKLDKLTDEFNSKRKAYKSYKDMNWLKVPEEHYTSIAPSEKTVDGGEETLPFSEVPSRQLHDIEAAYDSKKWGEVSVPDTMTNMSANPTADAPLPESIAQYFEPPAEGVKFGSNAMIAGGKVTETGQSMILGGPQMGYFKPPPLYEIGLHGAGFDISGVGIAGVPGTVMGKTPNFAWTITSARQDMIDHHTIKLHPNDRYKYKWNGDWHEMKCHTVKHTPSKLGGVLSGQFQLQPTYQEVCRIHEKNTKMPVIAWNEEERIAWVERRTTWLDEVKVAAPWLKLPKQNNLKEFRNALKEFAGVFNFLYADPDNIAYIHTGKIPIRTKNYDHRFPTPANQKTWKKTTYSQKLGTFTVNPEKGYVINWNNAPLHGWRTGDNAQAWGSLHRVNRLKKETEDQIAQTDGNLSIEDLNTINKNAATHDPVAPGSLPEIAKAGMNSTNDTIVRMAKELKQWKADDYAWADSNGNDRYDHPGHVIWDVVYKNLHRLTFEDELGDLTPKLHFNPIKSTDPHAGDHARASDNRHAPRLKVTMADALEGNTFYNWFNDIHTSRNESKNDMILKAFKMAHNKLKARFGTGDPSTWRMKEHKSLFDPMGAASKDKIDMVNRGTWNYLLDFAEEPPNMRSVLPPSNTAHQTFEGFLSKITGSEPASLSSQLNLYTNFDYKLHPVNRDDVKNITDEKVILKSKE